MIISIGFCINSKIDVESVKVKVICSVIGTITESDVVLGNASEFIDFMLKTILDCIKRTTQKTTQFKLNDNQIKILKLMKENSNITREGLSKKLNITSDG